MDTRTKDRAQKKVEMNEHFNRLDAVRALLAHRNGRDLLRWIIEITECVGGQAFAPNALIMSMNCGKREVGNRFLELLLEANPAGLATLLMEKANDYTGTNDRDSGSGVAAPGPDDYFRDDDDPGGT